MKELKEYKTEIFRRSRERIKSRKKIFKATLIAGISLCVCITVGVSIYMRSDMKLDSGFTVEDKYSFNDGADGAASESFFVSVVIEGIDNHAYYDQIDDSIKAEKAYNTISGIFDGISDDEDMEQAESDINVSDALKDEEYSTAVQNDYRLTFTMSDGRKRVYKLSRNRLTDVDPDIEVILTTEQLELLYVVLGL